LKKRLPFHDDLLLTNWYGSSKGVNRWRVLKYRLCQAIGNILLLDALDIIGRAGEAARLSGVELSQSFPGIRGSQYKVEGVLLRALQSIQSDERGEKRGKQSSRPLVDSFSDNTSSQSPWKVRRNLTTGQEPHGTSRGKRTGYFFFSPSKSDCNTQEALECQALTLEPKSGFHFDPVVVCDFTALYPSLIIAYNLCYSTIAGKLEYHSTRKEMRHQGKSRQA
jgi:DNA polymerase zeta